MPKLKVDGVEIEVPQGATVLQACELAGKEIPRFCYHERLAIAGNCRMCLVEVKPGPPKPQASCALPAADNQEIFTNTPGVRKAREGVMEFLLINHPLDCPICDQGGECDLQDQSIAYGRGHKRYEENKRAVTEKYMGPVVKTVMTRCIHCTRCVRFMEQVAGVEDIGTIGRGENLQIGTYIGKTIETELSGNIIDVCPVGALTNKPFQFKARAWELIAKPSIGYHDALGSNLWLHTRRGEVLRTVPRDNESINECWLSDRDRYSHQGMYAADRIGAPEVKRNGQWQATTWEDALQFAGEALKKAPGSELGILVHPATSNEEGDLLMRLARGLGSAHVDHRLRQLDFADNAVAQSFTLPVAELDQVRTALLVGSDLRHEMPLVNHRLHQAVKKGAKVYTVNPAHFDFNYKLAGEAVVAPQALVDALLSLARAAVAAGAGAPVALADAINAAQSDEGDSEAIAALKSGRAVVILGEAAVTHPQASWLRALARFIADATGAGYDELPVGANAVGLGKLGVLPGNGGLDAQAMLAQSRKSYLLYGVEPPHDFADGAAALKALHDADQVVAFSAYASAALRDVADVILPIALLPEIDATLVNVDGLAQGVAAGAKAPGQVRPGWKVLRALGGTLQLAGFEFDDLAGLRDGIAERASTPRNELAERKAAGALTRLATWPIYRGDAVLRRATALNAHPLNRAPAVRLNADEAGRQGLAAGDEVRVADVLLPLAIDATVPDGAAWIEAAQDLTATLPPYGAAITLSRA
jgi:NADH-quinone oxidoreductase subunit G